MKKLKECFQEKDRKPHVACLLTFVLPGLGQIYNREKLKGVLIIFLAIGLLLILGLCLGTILFVIIVDRTFDPTSFPSLSYVVYLKKLPLTNILIISFLLLLSVISYSALDAYFRSPYLKKTVENENTPNN